MLATTISSWGKLILVDFLDPAIGRESSDVVLICAIRRDPHEDIRQPLSRIDARGLANIYQGVYDGGAMRGAVAATSFR